MNDLAALRLKAPAKINVTLDVLARRADGYHEIESLMQTISLADEISLQLTDSPGIDLHIQGPCAKDAPTDGSNLAYKAARLFFELSDPEKHKIPGVSITIVKHIPARAGLGGGSTDAASVLLGLNKLTGLRYSRDELSALAVQIGADVGFFLYGGFALAQGIGEKVSQKKSSAKGNLLIAMPKARISTSSAYETLDKLPNRQSARKTASWPDGGFSNDFEQAVFDLVPEIAKAKEDLIRAGATQVLLCGSGAALAAFGDTIKIAYKIAGTKSIERIFPAYFIAEPVDSSFFRNE
jgi:4-diphosphocytidyl-2-C-methyl-D-erythritol kinase